MLIGIDARSLEEPRTGVGRYLKNLLEHWACSTHHRFVLYFKKKIPNLGILERPCYRKKIIKPLFGVRSNAAFQHFSLPRQAKKDKIDVFFSPAYILPLFYKEKAIVAIHDISYEAFPENLNIADKVLLRIISRISAGRAGAILTVSEFSRKEIMNRYGVPANKIFVTPLAADKRFMHAKPVPPIGIAQIEKINSVKEKFGISDKFIISVGTIFSRRHTDRLIEAFSLIANFFNNYQLIIIGQNRTRPFVDIDRKIKDANNGAKRTAIVRRDFAANDDLTALFGNAEMLVYLSDYEGFGLPPLEAALARTPVITSDTPAMREVMGEAAIFVKNNKDAEEISRSIGKIITDKNLKEQLVEKGMERARLYDWSACAKKTMEVLEKVFIGKV